MTTDQKLDRLEKALIRLGESERKAWDAIGELSQVQTRLTESHEELSSAMASFTVSTAAAFQRQDNRAKESSQRLDRIEKLIERFIRARSNGRN